MNELVDKVDTSGASATTAPLIWTKLQCPVVRRGVQRPRLVATLQEALASKVTLVSAPAGWGKSTLLADWYAAGREQAGAWVELDDDDNDPVRFWTYLIEALHAIEPTIGQNSSVLLRTPGVATTEVISLLINELDGMTGSVVLVLEDYHAIQSPAVHDAVTFLVERLPQQVRLVISTRSEPPLPLARWRARGELVELGARQLSFSEDEAGALLNEVHRLGLAAEDVGRLRERTEGWAAGLYLAVLSLRGRHDTASFIQELGEDRLVVDYLSEEVLSGLSESMRRFLLRTSILERFSASLCDAVVDTTGSERLLAEIERSNSFLVPLDQRRLWYRYHHLFRELLRHELRRREPEIVAELHRRACSWLLANGLVSDAIHHAIAGSHHTWAAELVAEHWHPSVQRGEGTTVDRWLEALPTELVAGDARLSLARAWTSFALGRLDEVVSWAEAAERAPVPGPFYNGISSVEGAVATVLASFWHLTGDMARTRDVAEKAAALEEEPGWLAIAFTCLGAASYWLGDSREAASRFSETVRLGQAHQPLVAIYALGHQAVIAADDAEWSYAEDLATQAIRLSDECGVTEYWMASPAHLARCRLLQHRGEAHQAEHEARRSLELARRGSGALLTISALLSLAELRGAAGDEEQTRSLLSEARAIMQSCNDPGIARQAVDSAGWRAPRDSQPGDGRAPVVEELSDRELSVLRKLDSSLSQREIGTALHLSLNTVKTHTSHIFRKLGVSSRRDAVARARSLGLL